MLSRQYTYAIHPDTKYEARPNALEAWECSALRGLPGGIGGLALVEMPPPRSVEGNRKDDFFISVSTILSLKIAHSNEADGAITVTRDCNSQDSMAQDAVLLWKPARMCFRARTRCSRLFYYA